jgi:hypothetical protein
VKVFVLVLMLVLLSVPCVAKALDVWGCDVWLEKGNVLMWAACRVGEWIEFNEDVNDMLMERGQCKPV